MIKLELDHEGYVSEIAADGKTALEMFEAGAWDVILLDVMLPQMNGLEVLRRIRKTSHVPIILVTARNETFDRVTGLDVGADDYLTKPFAMEELLARIRSLLRRKNEWSENGSASGNVATGGGASADGSALASDSSASGYVSANGQATANNKNAYMLYFGDISINTKSCTVVVAEKQVTLTKTEYDLLCFFVQHKNEALSRDKIIDAVWGKEHYIESSAVDVYVRYLRSKIDRDGEPSHITTLRGIGYIMKDEQPSEDASASENHSVGGGAATVKGTE